MQLNKILSITNQIEQNNNNPLSVFVYALKAPETRRQYPRRLKVFLDYLDLGTDVLEDQAGIFLSKAKENPIWAQNSFMDFIRFQKERVGRREISDSTVPNYYKATKLFCEVNDFDSISWKKIARGLLFHPRSLIIV